MPLWSERLSPGWLIVSSHLLNSNIVVKVPSILRDIWEARGVNMFRPGACRSHLELGSRRPVSITGLVPAERGLSSDARSEVKNGRRAG